MSERIKVSCPCGAAMEIESDSPFSVVEGRWVAWTAEHKSHAKIVADHEAAALFSEHEHGMNILAGGIADKNDTIRALGSRLGEAEAALHDVARGRYVRFADYIITHPEVKS